MNKDEFIKITEKKEEMKTYKPENVTITIGGYRPNKFGVASTTTGENEQFSKKDLKERIVEYVKSEDYDLGMCYFSDENSCCTNRLYTCEDCALVVRGALLELINPPAIDLNKIKKHLELGEAMAALKLINEMMEG